MAPPTTRPGEPPSWATNAGTRDPDPLPAGLQATGWIPGQILPALGANALWGRLSDWARYLWDSVPAAGEFALTALRIWDTAEIGTITKRTAGGLSALIFRQETSTNTSVIGVGTVRGAQTIAYVDPSVDRFEVADLGSGSVVTHFRSGATSGLEGFAGFVARANAAGQRYRFPSSRYSVLHFLGPSLGGWTIYHTSAVTGDIKLLVGPTNYVGFLNGSASSQDGVARRQIDIANGTGWSGATMPILYRLSADFAVGSASDTSVRLIEVNTATGAETVRATINGAGNTATPNYTAVANRLYFVELYCPGLGGSAAAAQSIANLSLEVQHAELIPGV